MSIEDQTMFRLIGFVVGSVTSIFIILLVIGMPTFNLADQEADQERYDAAIEKLRAKQHEFEAVAGKLSEDVARVAESVETGLDAVADTMENNAIDQATAAETPIQNSDEFEEPDVSGSEPMQMQDPFWYSFWNPFRSEIAAKGFVSQLEKVTGLDYRVVKVKTGVYEVAFAYHDDSERRTRLSQISAATGLDLPDSR
jgi:hypothetical protein